MFTYWRFFSRFCVTLIRGEARGASGVSGRAGGGDASFLDHAPGSVVQVPQRSRDLVLVSGGGEAGARAQVLSHVRWQAEDRSELLPLGDVQAAGVGGEAPGVGGVAAGGDAAVGRALAADLLELARRLGWGPDASALAD